MARVLTRRNYIKWKTRLYKSTKPSTIFFVVSTSHIALIQGSTPHRLRVRASEVFGHFGLIFDQNLPFFDNRVLVRIELRGAIVELARKSKMA